MPGPRYHDWSHVHVHGDREAAAKYLPEVRKLMGYVHEDAARNNLGTHVLRRQLSDGTLLVAEKHGAIPRMTIVPGGGRRSESTEPLSDIVLWPRDSEFTYGYSPTPYVILQRKDSAYKTFFWSGEASVYDRYQGRKGTYAGRLPYNSMSAGNVDWEGGTGVRLSWYGPHSRYLYTPYYRPNYLYRSQVFMLGRELLDVADYADDPDNGAGTLNRYVMGAAIRFGGAGAQLYVVQSDIGDIDVDTLEVPTVFFHTAVSQPYPLGNVSIQVVRYDVAVGDVAAGDVAKTAVVVPGSHKVLFADSIEGAVNPWFFDRRARRAVTHTAPQSSYVEFMQSVVWTSAPEPDSYIEEVKPSTTSARVELTLSGEGAEETGDVAQTTVSLTVAPGTHAAEVAADYNADDNLVSLVVEATFETVYRNNGTGHVHWGWAYRTVPTRVRFVAGSASRTVLDADPEIIEMAFGGTPQLVRPQAVRTIGRLVAADIRRGALVVEVIQGDGADAGTYETGVYVGETFVRALAQADLVVSASVKATAEEYYKDNVDYQYKWAGNIGVSAVAPQVLAWCSSVFVSSFDYVDRPGEPGDAAGSRRVAQHPFAPASYSVAPATHRFGKIQTLNFVGSPSNSPYVQTLADYASMTSTGSLYPHKSMPDFNGFYWGDTLVCTGDVVAFSGGSVFYTHLIRADPDPSPIRLYSVTDGDLAALSGLEANDPYFMPMWAMGAVPRILEVG